MACGFSTDDAIKYKDNELPQNMKEAFKRHLDGCEKCKAALMQLTQIESAVSETAVPGRNIAEETVSRIRLEHLKPKESIRWNFLPYAKKIALPLLGLALAAVLITFWHPLASGIESLISGKYSSQGPDNPMSGIPAGDQSNQTQAAATPGATGVPAVAPDATPVPGSNFAIYKASVSLEDIYADYSDKNTRDGADASNPDVNPSIVGNAFTMPYDSVLIDKVPIDETPVLTDADIETYYDGTMIFKSMDDKAFQNFLSQYQSVRPLPLVITVDGKAVAWGVYMSPLSSLSPPPDTFHLTVTLPDRTDGCYFILTIADPDRLKNLEGLISQAFLYAGKRVDKSNAPLDLTGIYEREQGADPQPPTEVSEPPATTEVTGPPAPTEEYSNLEYLQQITLANLNAPDNAPVSLTLPEGWTVTRRDYPIDPSFSFLNPKNTDIKSLAEFTIYAPGVIATTWTPSGPGAYSGIFGIYGYYRDQPESTIFNNHSSMVKQLFDGNTVLGAGKIYLMDCDIPRDMQTGDQKTYSSIFAWIPIDGENLAYCLEISVPQDQGYEKTYEDARIILGVTD